ncbi:MAG: septum formation protein Maf [Planctomycetota bacterium]|nr:MAG: septum formation protein Maf [Planctomycetota bacterium]
MEKKPSFILASKSPQRIRLLKQAGYTFGIRPCPYPEPSIEGEPRDGVLTVAGFKADQVAQNLDASQEDLLVVGADTIVVLENQSLGKPQSLDEAFAMISRLQGTVHSVLTGVAIASKKNGILESWVEESLVEMDSLSDEEIWKYLRQKPTCEKAGAVDIESIDFARVIKGSYSNVVGFPIESFQEKFSTLEQRSSLL